MSAKLRRRPIGPGARPPPVAITGMCSRVWSVPRQVGSQPWSARDEQQVVAPQDCEELGQSAVEVLERGGVAVHVAAMPVEHVEVDEIGEYDRAVRCCVERLERGIEQRCVAGRLDLFRDALVGIDVRDLADADHAAAGGDELVQHGLRRRRRREVAPVAGAREVVGAVADEGPRDDPPDAVFVDEFARDLAQLVQAVQAEGLLVAGDLEDAVGRGVDDRLAGPHVFDAELSDDLGTRSVTVSDYARQVRAFDQLLEQRRRKSVRGLREIAPVEQHGNACDLPVPARRVLAGRQFLGIAPGAVYFRTRVDACRVLPALARLASNRPSLARLGSTSGPDALAARSRAMPPSVSAPASPKRTASSVEPMPKESSTRMTARPIGPL